MEFKVGQLEHAAVIALLQEHHQDMLSFSPPESVHALDLSALKQTDITFWSLWVDQRLAGVGALKELESQHGEIKSMRTSSDFLREGIASKMLAHIIDQAKGRSYKKLSLETGTMGAFVPAQKLYQQFGFRSCEPFADYQEDPYSLFMTKTID